MTDLRLPIARASRECPECHGSGVREEDSGAMGCWACGGSEQDAHRRWSMAEVAKEARGTGREMPLWLLVTDECQGDTNFTLDCRVLSDPRRRIEGVTHVGGKRLPVDEWVRQCPGGCHGLGRVVKAEAEFCWALVHFLAILPPRRTLYLNRRLTGKWHATFMFVSSVDRGARGTPGRGWGHTNQEAILVAGAKALKANGMKLGVEQ